MTQDINRFTGCLLGLAVGDAVGTTVEFSPPGTFEPLTDMVGGGPFRLAAGEWTDDTSMALCLADSLICCGFNAQDQLERYCRWWHHGLWSSNGRCFDIGMTCRSALAHFEATSEPFNKNVDPHAAGNGSLMRLAPVAMFYADDARTATNMAAFSSRTTHAARTCLDACRYFAGLLVGALRGTRKETLLRPRYRPYGRRWQIGVDLCLEIDAVAAGSYKRKMPPDIKGSGYVVRSLEAALWAFYHSDNFRDGCLLAANLGDDADTTAAIYGQLAGAYYGVDGIPAAWRHKLARRDEITHMACKLFTASIKSNTPAGRG